MKKEINVCTNFTFEDISTNEDNLVINQEEITNEEIEVKVCTNRLTFTNNEEMYSIITVKEDDLVFNKETTTNMLHNIFCNTTYARALRLCFINKRIKDYTVCIYLQNNKAVKDAIKNMIFIYNDKYNFNLNDTFENKSFLLENGTTISFKSYEDEDNIIGYEHNDCVVVDSEKLNKHIIKRIVDRNRQSKQTANNNTYNSLAITTTSKEREEILVDILSNLYI